MKELTTCDYLSASVLRAKGFPLADSRLIGGGRVEFVFEWSEKAAEVLEAHESGSGVQLNSSRFVAALTSTKNALFGLKRGGGAR